MSLNKNLKTRRKQLAILAAVIVGGAAATAALSGTGNISRNRNTPRRSPPQT